MLYPIAETFHSIKGEGYWTGTAMFFIRFAGCNVGKDYKRANQLIPLVGPHMTERTQARECCTYDGRKFFCDTDFHKYEELTEEQLTSDIWEDRVVLTGGEPLIHLKILEPLLALLRQKGKLIHLETSGTISWAAYSIMGSRRYPFDWVAIAPKANYLPEPLNLSTCDELKFLVDESFDEAKLPREALIHPRVYLQPVNPPYGVDKANIQRCLEIQKRHPSWILCPQLHKLLGVK